MGRLLQVATLPVSSRVLPRDDVDCACCLRARFRVMEISASWARPALGSRVAAIDGGAEGPAARTELVLRSPCVRSIPITARATVRHCGSSLKASRRRFMDQRAGTCPADPRNLATDVSDVSGGQSAFERVLPPLR